MPEGFTSRLPGFYKKSIEDRLETIANLAGMTTEEKELLRRFGNLDPKIADAMIENVIGGMTYPFAVATNFRINGRDVLVPMVIEESSVVAAASNAAKMLRDNDGIRAVADKQFMIGQVHIVDVASPHYKALKIIEHKEEILDHANQQDPVLVKLGGGARDLEVRIVDTPRGPALIIHLVVDVLDAMGANAVNTMVEAIAPLLERITKGRVIMRIITNNAVYRLARAWAKTNPENVGGRDVAEKIEWASILAEADPYRAATHNKGIMNGVIAVALATAQDHRAIEAGAHAYAARTGVYKPLSRWEIDEEGDLVGSLEMPLQVGIVGGAVKVHPIAQLALKIMGVNTARGLAEVMAAVGLAQNLAALRALVTEGIQRGHMKLHAKNLAVMAGATGDLIDKVAEKMIRDSKVRYDYAKELVEKLAKGEEI
ncbi:MAG: hydroxymethylglutaryl-CoA reductase, degradative [Desulfurococcales archaeon]|nr:hydroxymethylglutaryl-CoA reductase, degradative [Desulfurococcales archaeon]